VTITEMSGVVLAWCSLLLAIAVGWLYLLWELFTSERTFPMLRPERSTSATFSVRWPSLSVIIPARNEEEHIERCLRHVLTQDYAVRTGARVTVVVVDDRSTDQTADKVRRVLSEAVPDGAEARLLQVTEVPEGWAGKPNAMRMGVEATRGEWVVFLDADSCLSDPTALRVAMADAVEGKCAFHTLIPTLELETFWDKFLQPVFGGLLLFIRNPRKANDPNSTIALGCGMYMAFERESLGKMGGLEAVRGCLCEDLWLARLCKDHGLRLRIANQEGLLSARMYRGLVPSYRGWLRIMQTSLSRTELATFLAVLPFHSLASWCSPILALMLWPEMGFLPPVMNGWVFVLGVMAWVIQCLALLRYYHLAGLSTRWVAVYPAAILFGWVLLGDAFLRKLRGASVTWRGVVYVDRPPGC